MEAILKEGLAQLGLDTGSIPALTEFSRRLLEKNQVMNLTAITEPADVARLHLLDCACLLTAADFRGKQVVDVGTGAGFPGMPLRLLEPDFDLTLLDSLGKRIDFLQETVDAMGLQRVRCVHARAEEFARQHREQFDIAASRAVAQLNVLCELALPLVKVGGQFLAMKSVDTDDEIQRARSAIAQLGGQNWKNLGLHHSRNGGSPPGGHHPEGASHPGSLSPALRPHQKSAVGLSPQLYTRYLDMGKIIAVVSGKGGTGKTSFTANVGLALAALGKNTLCLDCDITLRNLDLALGLTDKALMDFSDVIAGRCSLSDATAVHPKYPGLHLLTAPLSPGGQLDVTDEQMRQLLDQVRQEYDYCLIDAPAGLGQGFRLATGCADCVVVITTTDASALRDAQHTVMLLDKRFTTENLFLVVGRVQKKLLRALHSTIDDAMDAAGLPLLGVVPEDGDVPYALNRGIPLRDINYYAARAYENIARRITGHQVPLMRI